MLTINTPLKKEDVAKFRVGDQITLVGRILCGRDAVLPKIVKMLEAKDPKVKDMRLAGSVIFHTAVSPAGIGPTSSNKVEIEGSIPGLSAGGVLMHLGKGALKPETVEAMRVHGACFAVTPPTTALFAYRTTSQKVLAFPEEGMEALYEVEVTGLPVIIAAVNGETMFAK
ncbi:MAG: fumarate hydratase C-terminal domain-containing protein [Desulfovibrio sp.]|jgi:fumarate hydratase subunit beta|nr:fumarate hydratase C-terminal domain-containing protein [Desulfovibrio sp.]